MCIHQPRAPFTGAPQVPVLLVCVLSHKCLFLFYLSASRFLWRRILHALPSQTAFNFLAQQHNKLCHFISDIMDYLLAGEDPATNQSPLQPGWRCTLTCKL